ncbi:MAG: LacI family DNA-binding transcriptional regulator [Gammaproteobacteria bacterium]|nr:LacI family DNA-binding transcriptional regulator [Gammaproteobacteria bacterium]
MKNPTIHDVASLAGVSIKTVSRVLNNEPNVRPSTRETVSQAIETLGYRPDPSARRLSGSRSYLVGLLYDNPSASYIIDVQSGVLETCRERGYELLIYPCDTGNPDLAQEVVTLVRHAHLDGLILTPPVADSMPLLNSLRELGTPLVRIAPGDEEDVERSIVTNDREASRAMTDYLASLGHERIGFIIGNPAHKAVLSRYEGFLDALRSLGREPDDRLVEHGDNSFASGVDCGRRLLAVDPPPTAIFASNDDMAAGVMKAAHELGLAIPAQLSVAGFDDIPLAAQIWPGLTTIRQPIQAMASRAMELLLAQVNQGPQDIERAIPSRLVTRESTGRIEARSARDHRTADSA